MPNLDLGDRKTHISPEPLTIAAAVAKATTPAPVSADPKPPGLGSRYWVLWAATALSSLGDGLVLVGFPLLAATLTRSGIALSGLLAALSLPWLVCALPLGALADRSDRRRVAIGCEFGRMAVLGAFAMAMITGHVNLGLLYGVAFVLGTFDTAFCAATSAVVPELVTAAKLPRANGHLFAARTGGEQFIGPAVGGVAFAMAAALPFILDGVSFVASALLLVAVFARPRHLQSSPLGPRNPAKGPTSVRHEVGEGLRFITSHDLLRSLAVLIAGFALCQAMVLGVLVKFGLGQLHLSQVGYGLFLGAGALGNVVAGALAGKTHARAGATRLLIGSGIAAAVGYLILAMATTAAVAAAALFIECVAVGWGNVTSLSLRQRLIPARLMGRTSNAFRAVVCGAVPIGALLGGIVADASSVRVAFELAGGLQLMLVALMGPKLIVRIVDLRVDSTETEQETKLCDVCDGSS
ncbi:MAG: MFS transporter [Acidimicrobiales bacterium]